MRALPFLMTLIALLSACAANPPPVASFPPPAAATFDPAPMPFVRYQHQASPSLEYVIPPKMPPGTGAVPVSSSPVRGSIVTGFTEGF